MKLKEKTTLIIGTLAGILSGYQKEKIEQEYIRKQLKKTLGKYWQLAGNVEIVYGVMDHISWKLLAQTLESPLYEEMMSLYKEDELTDEQKARRQELVEMAQAKLAEALEVAGYNNKVDTHKEYILKLNVLGVDVKLTTEILNKRITMVEEYIDLLQSAIDSFAGGKDNAVVGKFNARLKNFTKRLLKIVEYINDNYPEEEFELNATEDDKNSFTNPIFNEDIITSDEGDTTKRFYTDFANAEGELIPDGQIDKNDVIILKAIIKNLDKLSKEDKDALVKAIDTNGDGMLNSDDSDWLTNYVQDQAEINSQKEQGQYAPYYENNLSDQAKQLITDIIKGDYHTENPDTPEAPATQTTPSSSSYLYNNSEVNGDNGETTDNGGETTTDNTGETVDNEGETTDNTGETTDNNGETPDVNVGD